MIRSSHNSYLCHSGLGGFGRAELEAELGDMAKAQGLNDRPRRGVRAGISYIASVPICGCDAKQ
jgi:hypothetical protein